MLRRYLLSSNRLILKGKRGGSLNLQIFDSYLLKSILCSKGVLYRCLRRCTGGWEAALPDKVLLFLFMSKKRCQTAKSKTECQTTKSKTGYQTAKSKTGCQAAKSCMMYDFGKGRERLVSLSSTFQSIGSYDSLLLRRCWPIGNYDSSLTRTLANQLIRALLFLRYAQKL